VTRPLKPRLTPRMSDAERADERRFVLRLVLATFALQVVGGALWLGLSLARHPRAVGGAPPMPRLPVQTGASDVRSQ
jgi:hypothetical protein